jgi:hypothetical protein
MQGTSSPAAVTPLARSPYIVAVLAWLIPGSGHLLLGRRGRGVIIFFAVLVAFAIGLLMRGPMFEPTSTGDVLSKGIQFGGFLADLAAGIPYFLAKWMGYAAPDVAGHNADYGAKFIVAAGLLNVLAIVDAYEIAAGEKD